MTMRACERRCVFFVAVVVVVVVIRCSDLSLDYAQYLLNWAETATADDDVAPL
jgi:hypothetical protein